MTASGERWFGKFFPKAEKPKNAMQKMQLVPGETFKSNRKSAMEAQIDAAFSNIRAPIDLAKAIADVKNRIVSETDDAERQRLSIQYAALMKYERAINTPTAPEPTAQKDLQGIPRLSNVVDEIRHPDFKEAEKVRVQKIDEPESVKEKKLAVHSTPRPESLEGTPVYVKRPAPPEFVEGQSDVGQVAK